MDGFRLIFEGVAWSRDDSTQFVGFAVICLAALGLASPRWRGDTPRERARTVFVAVVVTALFGWALLGMANQYRECRELLADPTAQTVEGSVTGYRPWVPHTSPPEMLSLAGRDFEYRPSGASCYFSNASSPTMVFRVGQVLRLRVARGRIIRLEVRE